MSQDPTDLCPTKFEIYYILQRYSFDVDEKLCQPYKDLPACPSAHDMELGTLAGTSSTSVITDTVRTIIINYTIEL